MSFSTTPCSSSRLPEVDFDNLGFGEQFADHMFSMDYHDGKWQPGSICPYGPISLPPSALCLHYGQSVFEGLKAYRGSDGTVRLFRPDKNYQRLARSCERLCIPVPDESVFLDALKALVQIDHEWIPHKKGQSFYLRPIIIGTEASLMVRASTTYQFMILASPVREFFDESIPAVSLKVESEYTRAAPGGMGYAKTAGNYAAALEPARRSLQSGFDQVLWLDGREHRYVEEVGQMNIFFKFKDRVVTPELRGSILPGVTRDSVITLLRQRGIQCDEQLVEIDAITAGITNGEVEEVFGTGTAAVVTPVGRLSYKDTSFELPGGHNESLARSLYNELLGIQHGELDDQYGWTTAVGVGADANNSQQAHTG